uniref:Protein shisa-5 n=1 Tax=Kryptolebias marmoratus TaxID=37003 RepID=A0A3Q3AGD8_KRYMA
MALGLPAVFVLVLCATFSTCALAWGDCESYTDSYGKYHRSQSCFLSGFCCGTCEKRECCDNFNRQLTKDAQDNCFSSPLPMIVGIVFSIVSLLVFICCCVCPCCCLYKMCRKPQPVLATTTHTTVITAAPQQYPQQPSAAPGPSQPYHGVQYAPYQPMPVQPGYGTQGMPTSPPQGQPFMPGPPPTYQEASEWQEASHSVSRNRLVLFIMLGRKKASLLCKVVLLNSRSGAALNKVGSCLRVKELQLWSECF